MNWGWALGPLKHLPLSRRESSRTAVPVLEDYKYSSLQFSSSEIRVFELCPALDDDVVHGKLIRAPLEKVANNYTALSYCWGSPTKTAAIYCDGRRLMITSSLHSALRRLRKLGCSIIWADAICIDQSDNMEKGAQVQMMGQIYIHAREVICDLGEADWEPQSALELMDLIVSTFNKFKGIESLVAEDFERYALPPAHDEKWRVLRILLSRPWFFRLWIQQEFALAKRAYMLWGLTVFEWEILHQAVGCISRHQMDTIFAIYGVFDPQNNTAPNQIYNLGVLQNEIKEKGKVRLIDLVYNAHGTGVTDPRDRVYSLLGLTVDAADPALYVDYSESTSSVYQRVGKRLVEKYGMDHRDGIKLLYFSTGPRDGLPSWAIDWNRDVSHVPMSLGGQKIYRATDKTFPNLRMGQDDPLVVVVAGSKFDSIQRVTNVLRFVQKFVWWTPFGEWVAEARALIADVPTYPTGEPSMHAYTTTLIADSYRYTKLDGDATTDSYTAYFAPVNRDSVVEVERVRRAEPFRLRSIIIPGRRFCVTRKGCFGLIPAGSQVGDLVCLLSGGDAPVVLRRDESDNRHLYIGDCYVHGIMYGEALKRDDFQLEDFLIK